MTKRLYIGTSGWVYKEWAGTFYPKGLPAAHQFAFYAEHFRTVEINATFYRLPPVAMVRGWREKAPPGFVYAIKGSRFITHMKKLKVESPAVEKFFDRIEPLRKFAGPILWQLPPNLHLDVARLEDFLRLLPRGHRYAVEFRHPSWLTPDTFALLKRFRTAHVSVSSLAMPADLTITTDFVYIRFHGLKDGARHDYTRRELKPWARHCREALHSRRKVFAYFNNDLNTRAPQNAQQLIEMVKA